MELLIGNLEKIAEHGQRADHIVKSMLEHSRGVSGERREVDLNGLVEETLNLAYHGARAQDTSFNVTLERDYAQNLKSIELAPQEMTRVFLNLFGNGFYATNKRAREDTDEAFRPVLTGTSAKRTIDTRIGNRPYCLRQRRIELLRNILVATQRQPMRVRTMAKSATHRSPVIPLAGQEANK